MAVAEATTPGRRASFGWRVAGAFVRRREASIFVVAVALFVYFWLKAPGNTFVQLDNVRNITETMTATALIAAGEVMLLICGEIDLAVGRVYALEAGREVRVMVKPTEVDDDTAILLSHEIAREIEDQLEYPGQIKVTVIRESRATDYAR